MRFNPFRPNGIASIGMFTGRFEEIQALDGMLHNTMHGNPQHFLLHGERGIGKSSLLFMHEITAVGDTQTFEGDKFNFLVVSLNLDGSDTYESVIDKLIIGLKKACAKASKGREFLKGAWEIISRFEAAGIKFRSQEQRESHVPLTDLVDAYSAACEDIKGYYDGILVLIDEADKAPVSAQLGSTLKTLTERVSRCRNNTLSIGLAGVSSLIGTLRASHESSPRLFTHLHLKPLPNEETERVIQRALLEANQKSDNATTITAEAKEMIIKLSEGYPNFIQEFGYCAFQADTDYAITLDDVESGAWSEHGAFAQLGDKYFKDLYLGKISSDSYRKVLQTMADHEDAWITKRELRDESGLSDTILSNALQALLSRQIILSREGKRGFYRLPSKSFSAWIRAYKMKVGSEAAVDLWSSTTEE